MHRRRFEFRGGNAAMFGSRDPEILLSGPAGTGKSLAILMKLFMLCERVDKLRVLMVREFRRSLTDTALVTFEDTVIPENHPILDGPARGYRHSYRFSNGAEIVTGGMNEPDKILSSDYDVIYYQEATEGSLDEWDKLKSRLRNGRLSYQQIIGDCNPVHPKHWIKQRCDSGKCKLFNTVHEDNPALFNRDGSFTQRGAAYISILDSLTGYNYLRLRKGIWCAAEGSVYPGWDDKYIRPYTRRRDDRIFLSVDFGYTHFAVCQWWAVTAEGVLHLFRELVRCHNTVEEFAKEIKLVNGDLPVEAVVCDHDKEDRATFEVTTQWITTPAFKPVEFGIHRVQEYINSGRLLVAPDHLYSRDTKHEAMNRPQGFLEELPGYMWDKGLKYGLKEEPVKNEDDSMDAARYAVTYHWHRSQNTCSIR